MAHRTVLTAVASALVVLAVGGCSDPYAERFPATDEPFPDSYTKAEQSLSSEDKALLDGYFARKDNGYFPRTKTSTGTGAHTIGEAIDDQKHWLETHPQTSPATARGAGIVAGGGQKMSTGARLGRATVGLFKLGIFVAVVVSIVSYFRRRSKEAKLAASPQGLPFETPSPTALPPTTGGSAPDARPSKCASCGLVNGAPLACRRCGAPL